MRLILSALVAALPLLVVGVAAQPVIPPLVALAADDPSVGGFTPVCIGPDAKWNAPQFFAGTTPSGGRVVLAWCQMYDGNFAGWIREQPASTANAPIAWLTDVAKRVIPPPSLMTVPANGTAPDRPAYSTKVSNGNIVLGSTNGKRAAVGAACHCDVGMVSTTKSKYCAFDPAPVANSVAVCMVPMPGM